MKTISRTFAMVLLLALVRVGVARAACGIGNKIWEGHEGALPWLAASTTNVWTMKAISTTFEIAGCKEEDNLFKRFASANFDHLAVEMARGEGEHLDVFAQLLQVREEDHAYFREFTQKHVPTLFSHDDVTVDEMLSMLDCLMAEDERLSDYVLG